MKAICSKTRNWLGRKDLFQTFLDELITDDDCDRDTLEIRLLLNGRDGGESNV